MMMVIGGSYQCIVVVVLLSCKMIIKQNDGDNNGDGKNDFVNSSDYISYGSGDNEDDG